MKAKLLFSIGLIILCSCIIPGAKAATINAANCSQQAVQAAVNSASNGDTVAIPAGACIWSGPVTITKNIIIYGNGQSSTTITTSSSRAFNINIAGAGSLTTPDFRLHDVGFAGTAVDISVSIDGHGTFRFDHLLIQNVSASIFFWIGYSGVYTQTLPLYGVFDHITFNSNRTAMSFSRLYGLSSSWLSPDDYGSGNAVYIEDSNFTWSAASNYNVIMDSESGARWVLRNNYFYNAAQLWHDTGSTSDLRGTRKIEMYNNHFLISVPDPTGNLWVATRHRGGTGVYYNNTFQIDPYGINGWQFASGTEIQRTGAAYGHPWSVLCNSSSGKVCSTFLTHCSGGDHRPCYPGGSECSGIGTCVDSCTDDSGCSPASGTCIQLDGQKDSYGWPCRDQGGVGMDDPITHAQPTSPIYWWSNKDQNSNTLNFTSTEPNYIQNGRDYCNHSPATACGSMAGWTYTPYTYPHPLTKEIINAANCSQQAVQAAVNSANRGDTVLVPAGSCAWSSTLIITKGLTLQGSGVDQTKINGKIILVYYQPDATAQSSHETLKITGFTFDGNDATNPDLGYTGLIRVFNPSATGYVYLVLKNNTIKNTLSSGRGLYITGACWGVASSNTFDRISSPLTAGGNEYDSWNNQVQAYGVAQNFYFEDNTISFSSSYPAGGSGWMESGGGGRYVVRYNTWDYTNAAAPGEFWDVHGLQSGPNCQQYSTMVAEFYGNKIINQMNAYRWMLHRGGWLLMFYNTLAGNTNPPNSVTQYYCNTCQDSAAYGGTATFDQKAQNSYYWRNLASNTEKAFSYSDPGTGGCPSDPVTENTDFFNYNANFDGTAGVGCGTLASRPSTCTTGVGYWATSQSCSNLTGMIGANPATPISGTLYKCTSTNNWTAYYTPYTYPHPLTLSVNPQTCSGTCCPSGQVCSTGYFTPSADCSSCCTGTCRTPSCGDGFCDPGETCPIENCCNGQVYSPGTQVCCSGSVYTGNCCSDSDCTSPKTCNNHVCTQLCDNLMLLMHFDNQAQYGESPTKAYDFSGNGNNGTVTGATWSSSGKFSGAFTYDGTNDLINVSIPSSGSLDIDSNPVTMVAWIKPNTVTTQQAVVARGRADGVNLGWDGFGFWINSNGKINVGSFGGYNFDGNTVLSPNTWYHVTVVINGASSALYLNGLDNTPASHTVNVMASSQPLKIGAARNGSDTADMRFFNGTIDELAIWNRSLSSSEIQNLYSSSSPISCGVSCLHKSDTNCDGCVKDPELLAFIDRWYINNLDVTMKELIEAIGLRNKGCSG